MEDVVSGITGSWEGYKRKQISQWKRKVKYQREISIEELQVAVKKLKY